MKSGKFLCENFLKKPTSNTSNFSEILWILTRERFPPRSLIKRVLKRIKYIGLDIRRLKKTDQKTCPASSPYGTQ